MSHVCIFLFPPQARHWRGWYAAAGVVKKVHVKYESKKSSVALGYMGRYVVCTPENLGCGGGVRDQFQSQVLIKRGAIKLEVNKSRILSGNRESRAACHSLLNISWLMNKCPKDFIDEIKILRKLLGPHKQMELLYDFSQSQNDNRKNLIESFIISLLSSTLGCLWNLKGCTVVYPPFFHFTLDWLVWKIMDHWKELNRGHIAEFGIACNEIFSNITKPSGSLQRQDLWCST